jgi:hypothetical protein
MDHESILFRDAVEELLYAYRNPSTVRALSAIAQNALLRAIRLGPGASGPGGRFLAAADLLRGDAVARGIGLVELASWSRPQSEIQRSDLWRSRHETVGVGARGARPRVVRRRAGYG